MPNTLYRHLTQLADKTLPSGILRHLRKGVHYWRSERERRIHLRRENLWSRQKGQGSMVIQLQPCVRMHIYFDSALCRYIYLNNFESEERLFLNLFLRPDDVFVDVGANIGLFTLIAARLVGMKGQVHAFEPCAQTFQRLQDNVHLNQFQNVRCHQMALSDVSQTMQIMASTEGLDGWNSFARPYMGEKFSTETVAATTWSEWAAANHLTGRVTMMKIDVEGWEKKVLQGAHVELLRRDAPVLQVEFTDAAAQAAGFSCRSVYEYLSELGYEVCRFDAARHLLVPDPIRESYPYCNLFAVKDRALVQNRLDASRHT